MKRSVRVHLQFGDTTLPIGGTEHNYGYNILALLLDSQTYTKIFSILNTMIEPQQGDSIYLGYEDMETLSNQYHVSICCDRSNMKQYDNPRYYYDDGNRPYYLEDGFTFVKRIITVGADDVRVIYVLKHNYDA